MSDQSISAVRLVKLTCGRFAVKESRSGFTCYDSQNLVTASTTRTFARPMSCRHSAACKTCHWWSRIIASAVLWGPWSSMLDGEIVLRKMCRQPNSQRHPFDVLQTAGTIRNIHHIYKMVMSLRTLTVKYSFEIWPLPFARHARHMGARRRDMAFAFRDGEHGSSRRQKATLSCVLCLS